MLSSKKGFSPAEMFFCRRQRSQLPTLQLHHQPIPLDQATSQHAHFRKLMLTAHDKSANDLPSLAINQRILVQHHNSKLWSIKGVIHSIRPDGISFMIHLPSGQHITYPSRPLHIKSHIPSTANSPSLPNQQQPLPSPITNHQSPPPSTTPITTRSKRLIKNLPGFLIESFPSGHPQAN